MTFSLSLLSRGKENTFHFNNLLFLHFLRNQTDKSLQWKLKGKVTNPPEDDEVLVFWRNPNEKSAPKTKSKDWYKQSLNIDCKYREREREWELTKSNEAEEEESIIWHVMVSDSVFVCVRQTDRERIIWEELGLYYRYLIITTALKKSHTVRLALKLSESQ